MGKKAIYQSDDPFEVAALEEVWRSQLKAYQQRQRPFRLAYQDAANRI